MAQICAPYGNSVVNIRMIFTEPKNFFVLYVDRLVVRVSSLSPFVQTTQRLIAALYQRSSLLEAKSADIPSHAKRQDSEDNPRYSRILTRRFKL